MQDLFRRRELQGQEIQLAKEGFDGVTVVLLIKKEKEYHNNKQTTITINIMMLSTARIVSRRVVVANIAPRAAAGSIRCMSIADSFGKKVRTM